MNKFVGSMRRWLWAVLLMPFATAVLSAELPQANLRYAVKIGDTSIGEMALRYAAKADEFHVTMETFANAKAFFLAGGNASTSMRYKISGDQLLLISVVEKSSGGERQVSVDWNKKAISIPEKGLIPMAAGHDLEILAFPASLLLRPIDTIAGKKVQVVSPNRVRNYIYEKPVEETIETPAGSFDTWRLRKTRGDKKPVTVSVWLTRDDRKIPVRMERLKRGTLTQFLLIKDGSGE